MTDLNFNLAGYMGNRTRFAFKSLNDKKMNKVFDLIGCSHSFFVKWVEYHFCGNVTLENYGSI